MGVSEAGLCDGLGDVHNFAQMFCGLGWCCSQTRLSYIPIRCFPRCIHRSRTRVVEDMPKLNPWMVSFLGMHPEHWVIGQLVQWLNMNFTWCTMRDLSLLKCKLKKVSPWCISLAIACHFHLCNAKLEGLLPHCTSKPAPAGHHWLLGVKESHREKTKAFHCFVVSVQNDVSCHGYQLLTSDHFKNRSGLLFIK